MNELEAIALGYGIATLIGLTLAALYYWWDGE